MNMIKAAYFVFVYIMVTVKIMWSSQELPWTVFTKSSDSKRWYYLIKTNRVITFEYG